ITAPAAHTTTSSRPRTRYGTRRRRPVPLAIREGAPGLRPAHDREAVAGPWAGCCVELGADIQRLQAMRYPAPLFRAGKRVFLFVGFALLSTVEGSLPGHVVQRLRFRHCERRVRRRCQIRE